MNQISENLERFRRRNPGLVIRDARDASELDIICREKRKHEHAEQLLDNGKGKGQENDPPYSEFPPTSARILGQKRRRERERSQNEASVSRPTTSRVDMTSPFLITPTLQCCPLQNHTPISNILTDIPKRLLGNDKGKGKEDQPLDSEIAPTSARILGQRRRREREQSQHDPCVSCLTTSPLLSTPTLQCCPLRYHTSISNILTDIPERLLGNDKRKGTENQPLDSVCTTSYVERHSSTLNVHTEIPPTSARILGQRRRRERERSQLDVCVSSPTTSPLLSTPTLQCCPLRNHTPISNILTDIPERLLCNDKWKEKESQPLDSVCTTSYLERLSSTINVPTEIPPTSARILAQRRRQRCRRERGNILTPTTRVVGSEEDCTRTFNLLPGNPRQQVEIRGHRSAFQCWNPIRDEGSSNALMPRGLH